MQDQMGVVGQVVEQRGQIVKEQRQVILDAGRRQLVRDVLVQFTAAGVAFKSGAEILSEAGDTRLVKGKFAGRQ